MMIASLPNAIEYVDDEAATGSIGVRRSRPSRRDDRRRFLALDFRFIALSFSCQPTLRVITLCELSRESSIKCAQTVSCPPTVPQIDSS
jgi:hypothetical protein